MQVLGREVLIELLREPRLLLGIGGQAEGWVVPQAAAEGFRGLRQLLRAFRVLLGARLLLGIDVQAEGWLRPQAAAEGFGGLRLLLREFRVLLGARLLLITRCRLFDLLLYFQPTTLL